MLPTQVINTFNTILTLSTVFSRPGEQELSSPMLPGMTSLMIELSCFQEVLSLEPVNMPNIGLETTIELSMI